MTDTLTQLFFLDIPFFEQVQYTHQNKLKIVFQERGKVTRKRLLIKKKDLAVILKQGKKQLSQKEK